MDIRKLQRAIVDGLEDVKAQDIVVFNTEHLSPLFERVIIATGTSNRQTKALASSVRESVKGCGLPVLATEGAENGEWIIVDCGAAVAHIMQPAIRDYYRLEEIWGDKPVRMKLAAVKGLVKASEPDASPPAAKKAVAAKKAAAKPPAARKLARQSAAKPAAKAPAKTPSKAPARPPAKKAVARRSPASRSAGAGTAPRKAAPRRG